MNKKILTAVAALSAATTFGVEYKWTGEVSSDFAEADNWLVKEGEEWVPTETPPTNCYGVATVVFDGDAALCPNQPEISTDYTIRDLKFLTSGWTIGGTGSLRLNHCFGGTNYTVDDIKRPNITIAVSDTSESGTNTIAVAFKTTFGYTYDIGEGATLAITGNLSVDNGPGNNLGSSAKHSRKQGAGTLYLGGNGVSGKLSEKYVEVMGGTLVLGRVNADGAGTAGIGGVLHLTGDAHVVYEADNQVADDKNTYWTLGGSSMIDFQGYGQTLARIAFGVKANDQTVTADWTGELLNSWNLKVGTGNSNSDSYGYLQVNTNMSAAVVLKDGLSTNCGRYNSNSPQQLRICAGDNPALDAELVIEGPSFTDRSGNLGVPVHYTGSTLGDGTYGAIALACVNGSVGQYAKVYIETTLYVNANTNATGSLGCPKIIEVVAAHGVLRGDGLVTPYTGSKKESIWPTIDVYGELAPGSINNPAGTLQIQRSYSKNSVSNTLHTGSCFRVIPAADGSCPQVVQNDGTFVLEQPEEGADESITAPKIVVSGAYAPAQGRHRVLTVTGTLNGQFAPEVVMDFPKSSQYTITPVYSQSSDGKTSYVDLKVSRSGLTLIIQ